VSYTMHCNNTRNLYVLLSLPHANKNIMSFLLSLTFFSSTKLDNKMVEDLWPGNGMSGAGGVEGGPNNIYTCKQM
jgi:hypothetical protein